MNNWTRNESPHILRALDCVFGQLSGNSEPEPVYDDRWVAPAVSWSAALPAGMALLAEAQPPPKVETQADLQAAYAWLLRERKRLEAYTHAQLTRLQHDHAALLAQQYTNEQVMNLRGQELVNKEEFLSRQTRGLQQQALQMTEREKALADQRERLCREHDQVVALRESGTVGKRDAYTERALLETLRAETVAVQRDRERARQDLEVMERRLQEQREARVGEQVLLAGRQAQLDQRFNALERAEEAAQRRLAELDDLEARLRQEIEEQENQLAIERRAVAALSAQLRQKSLGEEARRPLEGMSSAR